MAVFDLLVAFVFASCSSQRTTAELTQVNRDSFLNLVNQTVGSVFIWQTYSDWYCNSPILPDHYAPRITTFVNSESYATPRRRALLLNTFDDRESETWIFDKTADSWDKLNVPAPPHRPGCSYSLVTLCSKTIVMVRMATWPYKYRLRPDIWLLESENTGWKKVTIDTPPLHPLKIPKTGRLATVSIPTLNSSFEISESVLLMVANSSFIRFWKLTLSASSLSTITCTDLKQKMCFLGVCPHQITINSAAVFRTSAVVYFTAYNGIFAYTLSSEVWTRVFAWSGKTAVYTDFAGCRSLDCFGHFKNSKQYTVYSKSGVGTYNTTNKTFKNVLTKNEEGPDFMSGVFLLGKRTMVTYSAVGREGCRPILFEIRYGSWAPLSYPEVAPVGSQSSSVVVVGSRVYAVTFSASNTLLEIYGAYALTSNVYFDLWLLNLDAMRWLRVDSYERYSYDAIYYQYVSGSVLDKRVYIALVTAQTGCDCDVDEDQVIDYPGTFYFRKYLYVLGFVLEGRRWVQYQTNCKPPGRWQHSVAVLDETSMLIFGGYGKDRKTQNEKLILNDTWILTIVDNGNDTALWSRIDGVSSPSARFAHSMVRVGNIVVLYGGQNQSETCLNDFWHFEINNKTWMQPFYGDGESRSNYGPRLSIKSDCFSTATAVGKQAFVVIPCRDQGCAYTGLQLWMYLPYGVVWVFISVSPESSLSLSYSIFLWKEKITIIDTAKPRLLFSNVGCPAGYASVNITSLDTPCTPCSLGYYSTAGSTVCIECPGGLLTKSLVSTSIYDCNVCEDYCMYGVCLVVQSDGQPQPVCKCIVGFSGSRCQYPTYYLITLGIIAFFVFLAIGIIVPVKIWRKRKNRERVLVEHVEELQGVWQISEQEVVMQERIGRGGYGEVYLAEYRNLHVAVKLLRLTTEESVVNEFEREIKFMQTVRHPNIVLFLGAGRLEEDGTPFIVVEYMSRGSFRDLLDDLEMEIQITRKLSLCLDIANGMMFLHQLNPPRVHRDLKSDNLLISESWVGKIADFGLGKQIDAASSEDRKTNEKFHRDRVELNMTYSLSFPLLRTRENAASHGVGAARWRAPEISRHRSNECSTAADVYR